MFTIRSFILGVFVLVLALAGQGYAAVTTNDYSIFQGWLSGGSMSLETFEGVPLSGTSYNGAVGAMTFSDFSVQSTPVNALKILGASVSDNHNTTLSGSRYLSLDTDEQSGSADALFSFNNSINAFGLFFTGLNDGGTVNIAGSDYAVSSGSEVFFGIAYNNPGETSFSSLTIDMGSTDSHWSMDDVNYGTAPVVPEPISAVLFVVGGSVLAGRRFMKRRK